MSQKRNKGSLTSLTLIFSLEHSHNFSLHCETEKHLSKAVIAAWRIWIFSSWSDICILHFPVPALTLRVYPLWNVSHSRCWWLCLKPGSAQVLFARGGIGCVFLPLRVSLQGQRAKKVTSEDGVPEINFGWLRWHYFDRRNHKHSHWMYCYATDSAAAPNAPAEFFFLFRSY